MQTTAKQDAIERLREYVKPGDTLHTIARHSSRSGMSHSISVVQLSGSGGAYSDLTELVARATDSRIGKHGGVHVPGAGMDMGFHLVYSLSMALYPEYECLGERCPAAQHVNERDAPRGPGVIHRDGYAISQRWL